VNPRASLAIRNFQGLLRLGVVACAFVAVPAAFDPGDGWGVGPLGGSAHAKGPDGGGNGGGADNGNAGGNGGGNGGGADNGNAGGNGKGRDKDEDGEAEAASAPTASEAVLSTGSAVNGAPFSGSSQPAGPDLSPTEEEDLISRGWK